MNLYESRAITRARQTLSLLINEALLDADLSIGDLSALTGIDVDRLHRIVSGGQMHRGEIKFVEVIHLFDVLQKEIHWEMNDKIVPGKIAQVIKDELDNRQIALFNEQAVDDGQQVEMF